MEESPRRSQGKMDMAQLQAFESKPEISMTLICVICTVFLVFQARPTMSEVDGPKYLQGQITSPQSDHLQTVQWTTICPSLMFNITEGQCTPNTTY